MHSGKGLRPHRSWCFHPLEFGLSGAPGAGKTTLAARLAPLVGEGTVLVSGSSADPDEVVWSHLARPSVLIDDPPPGLVLPRVLVVGPQTLRLASLPREVAPVAVAGAGRRPRRLPWSVPWFSRDDIGAVADFIRGYWDSQLSQRPLSGLVLTGGRGSLMGRDKAELEYDGRSLVARTFELLSGFCPQVWVSCRPDQADSPSRRGFPQIHDKLFDRGPLGGLLSALEYRPEAAWLVLACDQPYLTEATVTELLAGRDPRAFATAFVGLDGLPEPLCAVYEPKSRLRLLQTWALGYPCPRKLLAGPGAVLLQPSRPETLTDVNTPRDDQRARAALGSM